LCLGADDDEEPGDDEVPNRPADLRGLAQELGAEARLTVAAATYTLEADLLGEPANVPVAGYLVVNASNRGDQDRVDALRAAGSTLSGSSREIPWAA
jgi:hypothetical protein